MARLEVPDTPLSSANVDSNLITEPRLTALWAITLWYNGVGIKHGSDLYHISSNKPPSLQTLIGCSDEEWEIAYKPVLEFFAEQGGVTEKTITRRTVRWAPTDSFLNLSAELFADHLKRIVVPNNAFNSSKGHIGDPLESLLHRTSVEFALAWLEDAGCQWTLYPGKRGHPRPDIIGQPLHSDIRDTKKDADIEIISDHHNAEMYIKKYAMLTKRSRNSTWIFRDREAATKTINHLTGTTLSGYLEDDAPRCNIDNAPVNSPDNYAITTLNRYLKQSREKHSCVCTGMDYVDTLTGLYERCNLNYIRRPVSIWNTNTNEIELHGPLGRTISITLEELNAGAKLRMNQFPPSGMLPGDDLKPADA